MSGFKYNRWLIGFIIIGLISALVVGWQRHIVEENNRIIGGGGIAKLDNFEGNICELQKMYFLPEARGRGVGSQMMEFCLAKAKEFGFEKIYLETMEYMTHAQKLYKQSGFEYIDAAMGDTGHYSCPVHMVKTL